MRGGRDLIVATMICVVVSWRAVSAPAQEPVVLQSGTTRLTVDPQSGSIVEFRFLDSELNPLTWDSGDSRPGPRPRGHFLCLDRWGAPSEAEAKNGVPFHGEASRVVWSVPEPPRRLGDSIQVRMECELPLAGMSVDRVVRLAANSSCVSVTETVTNRNPLGRVYNVVQHPSIAPPFLDDSTRVEANASHGFWQEGEIPDTTSAASRWPWMIIAGNRENLGEYRGKPGETGSDVSSFRFDDDTTHGWVTALNPEQGLLLGYIWSVSDYPWLNIWRYMRNGDVAARGLEFGTTGYHQPFGELVARRSILDRPLVDFLDAGGSRSRSYLSFLLKVPSNFAGVARVEHDGHQLSVVERGADSRVLRLVVPRETLN